MMTSGSHGMRCLSRQHGKGSLIKNFCQAKSCATGCEAVADWDEIKRPHTSA